MTAPKPTGRLQAQIESFAREIHALRQRVAVLEPLAQDHLPGLKAPPMVFRKARPARAPDMDVPQLPAPLAPWWPRPFGPQTRLRPAPGHRCAGLMQADLPVFAVNCCGLDAEGIAKAIDLVVADQIRGRDFLALYLTDAAHHLHLFRHQGLDVELLPTDQALTRVPGIEPAPAFLFRRLSAIAETWGVSLYRDEGARPLPWPKAAQRALRPLYRLYFSRDYRRHNPYQHLLYMAMPEVISRPGDIDQAIAGLAQGPLAFHLNWEEALYRGVETEAAAVEVCTAFLDRLDVFLAGGGKLIWTLHNEAPHDNPHPEAYALLARALAARTDLCLVHSARAAEVACQTHGLAPEKLCLLPHGGYQSLYPVMAPRAQARKASRLPDKGLIFGFVGAVRPYKNLPLLVEAFARAALPARLLIAGLQNPVLDLPMPQGVILRNQVIPETAISDLLRSCDAIVLPFDQILTSGSMMLALSHGVPVIVPDHPSLTETVFDGVNGLTFAAGDADALAQVMTRFAAMPEGARAGLGAKAQITAQMADWDWIGRHFAARIAELFAAQPAASSRAATPA